MFTTRRMSPNFAALCPQPSGGAAVTFDPVNKGSAMVLSNGNLTASKSGAIMGARSSSPLSGKKFWRLAATTVANDTVTVGIGPSTVSLEAGIRVASNGTYTFSSFNASVVNGTAYLGDGAIFTSGDILDFAIDVPNSKLWMGKNGVWFDGSPSAGTGGYALAAATYYAMLSLGLNDSVTARFADDSSGLLPSGFTWVG